jgi:hypothetical protein
MNLSYCKIYRIVIIFYSKIMRKDSVVNEDKYLNKGLFFVVFDYD